MHVPEIFSQFDALSQRMTNGNKFLKLRDKLKSLKLADTNSPQSSSVPGSDLDQFVKGDVPSSNSLPGNPKPFFPLGSTQLLGSTQDAQFVRFRQ